MIKEFDIHYGMPTVEQALYNLDVFLRLSKNEKIIKIIHGYGSSGRGGKIKNACREVLLKKQENGHIKGFIPGEAFSLPMGYDALIRTHLSILKTDRDFGKGNDGITYVII